MINFFCSGRLTKKPEGRLTNGGVQVATYTVACKDGDHTSFLRVNSYGTQATNDLKYLDQGHLVSIAGKIKTWYDRNTEKGGTNFDVVQIEYMGRPKSDTDEWANEYKQHST